MRIETRVIVLDDNDRELEPGTQCGIWRTSGEYEVGVFDRVENGKLHFKHVYGKTEFSHRPSTIERVDRVRIEIVE